MNKFASAFLTFCVGFVLAGAPAFVEQAYAEQAKFRLTSTDVTAAKKIGDKFVFSGFGCTGGNLSPALEWKNAPKDAKSFAITVYDPDAPTGSGWWHWLAFNLPATTTSLATGAGDATGSGLPAGTVQSRTDFGAAGYGGPCPPQGDKPHHYIFTVFALKTDALPMVDANSSAAMVGYFLNANALAKATLNTKYGR